MNAGYLLLGLLLGTILLTPACSAQDLPDWVSKIRIDHPRLFFNADSWPAVKSRALNEEKAWYESVKARVDRLLGSVGEAAKVKDYGPEAAQAAFVFLMTGDERYASIAKRLLDLSLSFYEQCYEERKSVNWYSTSRVHAAMAWDWLYNDLTEMERINLLSRLVQVLQKVYTAQPPIYRENLSGYTTGFYGATNCKWFIGCTAYGTGIEERLVNEWLVWGYNENMKMLEHRKMACGDDGGAASPTLGYAFGAYPWAEQNFFYTWLSATGENIAPNWPHSAWLANYVIWNWIETGDQPLEFGYGDSPHTSNTLPTGQLYTHMANIRHLYGQQLPEAAALARYVQQLLPKDQQTYTASWFIYPFLLTDLETSPPPFVPETLPHARHFDKMGQIYMRSGTGAQDTYCLFTCGGVLAQHKHFDSLNFVIYHRGFLALDSGTRYSEFENGQHLANYYAQTVAHNCVVIHQPGEPPARYWGGTVEGCHGGQHKQLGSVVKAFETNDRYVYIAGDATECYKHGADIGEKVESVCRQFVFLLPNHFVIFDRVTSAQPEYKKDWLLHTARKPLIEGRIFRADHGEGRMFCRTFLPTDAVLTLVGGPGNEFLAAGTNWAINTGNLTASQLDLMGRWRVEVTPSTPRTNELFLHVIQVGGQEMASMDAAELIQAGGTVGVQLQTGSRVWEVTFATEGDLAGHIRLKQDGDALLDTNFTQQVMPQSGILAKPG
ncbi:MAG: heparinase II/III domain-containing protein [Candidatus Zipacnadales bacterium]